MQQDEAQRLFLALQQQLRELNEKIGGMLLAPTVYSYEEARKRLMGMSESTLKRMIKRGLILRTPVGKSYGISHKEIERIAGRLVGPDGELVSETSAPTRSRPTPRLPKQKEAKADADRIRESLRKVKEG